jgi:lipid-A-disaccharide synthase
MKIAIVAGEASGDILGAGLITALKQHLPDAEFLGVAGPRMQAAGCQSLFPMETLSVMGLTEVLMHLPSILKARKHLIQTCLQQKPDIYIGIDAPDFNLGVAKKLKASGIKTVQYVSPSIWAWREGRIDTIKQATDLVLCLLPFEPAVYAKYQHPAKFVGHPLADSIPMVPEQAAARQQLDLLPSASYLALMPGSRAQEVKRLLPVFLQAAQLCRQQQPDLQFILPLAHEGLRSLLQPYQNLLQQLQVKIIRGQSHEVLAAADVVLLASGTATLEAMLYKRPMVVAYRLSALSYYLAKRLVKLKYFSLPNLLAAQPLVTELLQDQAEPQALAQAVMKLFTDKTNHSKLVETFSELHRSLQQNASEQAAQAVMSLLGRS